MRRIQITMEGLRQLVAPDADDGPAAPDPVDQRVEKFLTSEKGQAWLAEAKGAFRAAFDAMRRAPPRSVFTELFEAFERFRRELCGEVRAHIEARLFELNAQGVEWFGARAGWIFLADVAREVLTSVKSAAFNTGRCRLELPINGPGIVPHVYRSREGFQSNDVTKVPFYLNVIKESRGALSAPVFRPDGQTVLAVYHLEAAEEGAFSPAHVRDLQKKVAHLVPHLLALEALSQAEATGGWPMHPDLHGWGPERLLTRLCRTAAQHYAIPGAPPPVCTVWNVDVAKERCWTLAVSGFDHMFLRLETLGPGSAVYRTATAPGQAVARGTPAELGFERLAKAQRMNVRQALIAPLPGVGAEPVCGTVNLYFFEDRQADDLPADAAVQGLAACVQRLLTDFYAQREQLAPAYLQRELVKNAAAAHELGCALRVIRQCLDAPVGSIYVREPDTAALWCAATTGLEGVTDHSQVYYHCQRHKKSYACWLADHPGQVVRINWAPTPEGGLPAGLPRLPSNRTRERMGPDGTYHRRQLAVGVRHRDGARPPGMVRVLRSEQAKPFTRADERLLLRLGEDVEPLLVNWSFARAGQEGPYQLRPTSTRVAEVLQGSVRGCLRHGFPMVQATAFVHCDGAAPAYRMYAYHSREQQLAPEGLELPDALAKHVWQQEGRIVVVPWAQPDGQPGTRICVPLQVWSGPHLVHAIIALDYRGTGLSWNGKRKLKVFGDARRLAAIWAANAMRPDSKHVEGDGPEILDWFLRYLRGPACAPLTWARLRLWHHGVPRDFRTFGPVPERPPSLHLHDDAHGQLYDEELGRFGVQLARDGTCCAVPLMLGPFYAGELLCGLDAELAKALAQWAWPDRGAALAGESMLRRAEALDGLRKVTTAVTGPWCRLVAGNLKWWRVTFPRETPDGDLIIWEHHLGVLGTAVPAAPPAETPPAGRAKKSREATAKQKPRR
jgi:hypothetical protein